MYLGTASSRVTCLQFPASQTLTVRGPSDTVYITWTTRDTLQLNAVDSAGDAAGNLRDAWVGTTRDFAPADAQGWGVNFPSGKGPRPPVAKLNQVSACTQ